MKLLMGIAEGFQFPGKLKELIFPFLLYPLRVIIDFF